MAGGTRSKRSEKIDQEPEPEVNMCSLDLVKELLSVQESTMKSFLSVFAESTNTILDNIIKDIQALRTSLEFSQTEIAVLKEANCSKRLEALESNIKEMIAKTDDLENRSRRNNLCFEGIP